ncbi:hypothetical protein BDZ89DRAFT_1162052 [Hymenopellis radicata]|nr:hypothetical protein BDZ89DRAFT_1162052 [Hymenopellis radicata]
MRKLMGSPPTSPTFRREPPPSSSNPPSMSLAAFMGGRATGPRLNKHAPQQDAHDPTQFDQRTRIDAPHPIFGSKGVAMPGMTASSKSSASLYMNSPSARSMDQLPSPDDMRSRKLSTPSVASRYMEQVSAARPMSPQKPPSRDRTISTPTRPLDVKPPSSSRPPSSLASTSTAIPTIVSSHATGASIKSLSSPPTRPFTPSQRSSTPTTTASTPALARPIQPSPRTSLGPLIPPSKTPSPAFLKPDTPKDPTPSISRLQGRGFVQNMVKVSQELQGPPSSIKEETTRQSGRKSSVLDRWQPQNMQSKSPPASPKPSPSPIRKVRTVGPPASEDKPKSLKHAPSLPSMRARSTPSPTKHFEGKSSNGQGLGSATTMMIFKPAPEPNKVSFPAVDELGVHRTGSKVSFAEPEIIPEPRKPLAHPTKDRAKKPRKGKSAAPSDSKGSLSASSPVKESADSLPPDVSTTTTTNEDVKTPVTSSDAPSFVRTLNGSHVTDRWANHGIIQSQSPAPTSDASTEVKPARKMVGRQALPGMTADFVAPISRSNAAGDTGVQAPAPRLPSILTSSAVRSDNISPSPRSRIPSSGNRATVMDVAQAFSETAASPEPVVTPRSRRSQKALFLNLSLHLPLRRAHSLSHLHQSEEATPMPTPAGTLSRDVVKSLGPDFDELEELAKKLNKPEVVTLDFPEEPLPHPDVSLLATNPSTYVSDPSIRTISVDVMSISGNAATAVQESAVFYDSEIIVIIHRKKSTSSGLVSTTVWAWQGKNSRLDEGEKSKLTEIASRYGTSYIPVPQYAEPLELLSVLGGQLAIRQGSRAHWSADNTAMHVVRSKGGYITIDELDLNIKNLCSGFSYCVSVLDTIYVWHGCGAVSKERKAAHRYARTLGQNVVELAHGASDDDDDMFWMVLGEDEYAQADYWRWRSMAPRTDPTVWHVDASRGKNALSAVSSLVDSVKSSVFLVDCIWEIFVLVGQDARAQRQNIKLAISSAQELANYVSPDQPYTPTIHVLIFPSLIPLDLRLHFRDFDEALWNDNNVPNHMNLLSVSEALQHLQQHTWDKAILSDKTMLPLGIDPSHL